MCSWPSLLQHQEAIQSAIDEFKAQGVDLSNIVILEEGNNIENHPITISVRNLEKNIASKEPDRIDGSIEALESLKIILSDGEKGPGKESLGAILLATGAMKIALKALDEILSNSDDEFRFMQMLLEAIHAMLMHSMDMKKEFRVGEGTLLLSRIVDREPSPPVEIVVLVLQSAAVAALKHEEGKTAVIQNNLGAYAINSLKTYQEEKPVILASCSVLIAVTNADDDTEPSSNAFAHARLLAKEGAHYALLQCLHKLGSYTREEEYHVDAIVYTCNAMRNIAANDDICKDAANANAIGLALQLVQIGLSKQELRAVRAAIALLRQLSSSDTIKDEFLERHNEGFSVAQEILTLPTDSNSLPVLEQVFGLMANLSLRRPEIAEKAVLHDCHTGIVNAMQSILLISASCSEQLQISDQINARKPGSSGSTMRCPAALRQGCMAIRNMASRSSIAREALLKAGASKVVKDALKAFPDTCDDVGSAALRDLSIQS